MESSLALALLAASVRTLHVTRLEMQHVYPSSWSKMRVDHCSKVLSYDVADLLAQRNKSATRGTVVRASCTCPGAALIARLIRLPGRRRLRDVTWRAGGDTNCALRSTYANAVGCTNC